MNQDFNAITVLLTTQGLINIGSVPDPVTHDSRFEPEKARLFLDLMEILQVKTRGNLTEEEADFLDSAVENFRRVLQQKTAAKEGE